MAAGSESVILLERTLRAQIERVFDAWRDPRKLERWAWGSLGSQCRADVDFRVGGEFSISTLARDGSRWSFSGTYTDIEPNVRLSHTLAWDAPVGYAPANETVTVALAEHDGGTHLTFLHRGEFSETARQEHARGWIDVLDVLEEIMK